MNQKVQSGMAAGLYDITNEVLGKGHFAVVKLARHCLTSELVAVKIIDKTKLNKEGLLQQSQEVRILSRLSQHEHPNIVKLYQVIDTKSKLYLVMEYCGRDVCDLYDYIQKKLNGAGLEELEAKHIFRQICSAIAYCHSLRIVHRDLKPENLLILTQPVIDGQSSPVSLSSWPKYPIVKLIDFGFANQWVEGVKLRTSCGSLAYSAPEILLGDQYDGDKVDIWGLGCILYILLYGSNPFMQINDNETLCRILDCNFATPPRSNISPDAIDLIKALLKKDPTSRLTMSQVMSNKWFGELLDNNVNSYNYHYPHYSKNRSSPSHHRSTTRSPSSTVPVTTPSPPVSSERRPSIELNQIKTSSNTSNSRQPTITSQVPPRPTSSSRSSSFKSPPSSSSPSPPPNTSSNTFTIPLTSSDVAENTNPEVHDKIIDQMISQKMATSKESVERALKSSRVCSGSNRSSLSSLSNLPVVEEVVLDQEERHHRSDSVDKAISELPRSRTSSTSGQDENNGTNDSYISATYNLLKDKLLREMQGIPSSSTNVHEIRTSHKRGHILPGRSGRKPGVSQAPRFNRPGSGSSVSTGPLDEMSLQQKLQESVSGPDAMAEEVDDGFILPLQRKCSIVSEEGSVCELSGRLSHSGSDVHTFLVGDGKEPIVVKAPSVDIVITDFSDDAEGPGAVGSDFDTLAEIDQTAEQIANDQDPSEPVDVNDNVDLSADVELTGCINDSPTGPLLPGAMPTSSQDKAEGIRRPRGGSVGTKFMEVSPPPTSTINVPGSNSLLLSGQKHFVSSSPDLSRQVASYGILETGVSNIMDMKDLPAIDDVFGTDDLTSNDPIVCRTRTSTAGSRLESVPVGSYAREGYVRDGYGRDSSCGYSSREPYVSRETFGKDQVVDDIGDHVASRQGRRRGSKTTSGSSADSTRRDIVSPPGNNNSGRSSGLPDGQAPLVTFQLNKSNVNSDPRGPGGPTSVRVITQSKSCSNILSSANDGNGTSSNGSRNASRKGSRKHRNQLDNSHGSSKKSSIDSQSSHKFDGMDRRKNESRTDCCIIC